MRVRRFGLIEHPDFNDVVVHFTGRSGPSHSSPEVARMTDWQRLQSIVAAGELRGFEMPGARASAACFTEATAAGCSWLIRSHRYTSCGLAFRKDLLFGSGGGPVLQVRGDEWDAVGSWPARLRARAVRLWPGADADGPETLPWWLSGRSEWLYEREWRVPTLTGPFTFCLDDVAFLVLPSVEALHDWVRSLARSEPKLARALARCRYVVLGPTGIVEANGVAAREGRLGSSSPPSPTS